MGSQNRTTIIRYLILIYLATVLLVASTDVLFLSELKQYYTDTEQIIFGMANTIESKDEILKLLKEPPEASWLQAGTEGMAAYGYHAKTQTIWDQKYHSARQKILFFSAAFELILLLLFLGLLYLMKTYESQRTAGLERILCKLQDTSACVSETIAEYPDYMAQISWIDLEELDAVLKDRLISLQEQIQSDRSRIQQEKESTKALVTDISHQVKTPVAALKTSLELLATEEMSPTEQQEFLDNCLCQVDSLENLTKALVNVSRLEKGLIQITAECSDINSTLRSAVSRIYEKALEKHISIEMEEADKLPALHDKKWTAEVFLNILDNAIKYSPEHTHITIRLASLVHFVKIDIEDEGIGIPKSEYHKIFQRFYRGESVKDAEGSGIGLYLARVITEKQNGTIYVHSKSKPQTGSVFSVQLPKASSNKRSLTKL